LWHPGPDQEAVRVTVIPSSSHLHGLSCIFISTPFPPHTPASLVPLLSNVISAPFKQLHEFIEHANEPVKGEYYMNILENFYALGYLCPRLRFMSQSQQITPWGQFRPDRDSHFPEGTQPPLTLNHLF
jgi:hypothetical protein